MDAQFVINLLRLLAAQQAHHLALLVSREMFGRGYFSLGTGEKLIVDQAAFSAVAANYQALTSQFLEVQQAQQPMGFPTQPAQPTKGTPR